VLNCLLLGAVLYFVGKTLLFHISKIPLDGVTFLFRFVFLAVLFEVAARFFVGMSQHLLLKFSGSPLPLKISVSISWISLMGKYVPGKIALVCSAIYFFKKYKVHTAIAGMVPVLSTVITIFVALIFSIPMLILNERSSFFSVDLLAVMIIVFILFFLLNPIFFLPAGNYIFRRFGISEIGANLSTQQMAVCVGVVGIQCVCAGISTWLISRSVCLLDLSILPNIISITAFSGVMGLLVFFSPAGIGVRDGIFFITLGGVVGPENAALITVLLRVVQTLVDVGTFGIGAFWLYLDKITNKR